MADLKPGLILLLKNEQPLFAHELGVLFADLGRDYRELSKGGELVLAEIKQGSLWALFHDAAGFLTDVNALITFGKSLSLLMGIATKGGPNAFNLFGARKKKIGVRTVENLTKIAVSSKSKVELKYKGPEGEELFLSTTPSEASFVQDTINAARARPKQLTSLLPHEHVVGAVAPVLTPDGLGELAKRISISKQLDDGQASDLEAILAAVINQLTNNNMGHLTERIAVDLERQGYPEAAQLIRELAVRGASGRGLNPPLTT
jgi:hypothetical protein